MRRARRLLRAASRHYDSPGSQLPGRARRAVRGGFASGAEWMRAALGELRPAAPPRVEVAWHRAGLQKYGLALLAASGVVALSLGLFGASGLALGTPLFVLAFYWVEARGVFLFPVLLEGVAPPAAECRRLVDRAGGRLAVTWTTACIAAQMLGGGLVGRGFLRSWCIGCLAVVVWYEELRQP